MTLVEMPTPATGPAAENLLRIAVVAPPWFKVPPDAYGGIEALVAGLVDGLVASGHQVTLIAAGPAGTRAQQHISVYEAPPTTRLGEALPEVLHAAAAARILSDLDVDVVHDNTLAGPLTAGRHTAPVVATAHGPVTGEAGDYLRELRNTVGLVAVSDAQRRLSPGLNWVGRVHNAVDVASYPVGAGRGRYLLFVGRFCPEKGAHVAIDVARAAGRELVLAGKLNEPAEKQYFNALIRPHLGSGIVFVGEADARLKRELYAGAAALLFPACWEEPFGLVMAEAMASGTPVVALRRGSVPEIVVHGRTGFVVDSAVEMVEAVYRIDELDRSACRLHAEARFDLPIMVADYERVFRQLAPSDRLSKAPRT
jgi:glycosyltransferase involved in cell wall biosynthesis